jgi:adenylylsulfate kinase
MGVSHPESAKKTGQVIWITGLSGSGKTTVSRLLKAALERHGSTVVLLDGDELRGLFPQGDRYDRGGRLELAKSYGRLCRLLADQGCTVICATISMRKEIYEWNRANLPGYVEVFLDVAADMRAERDPKRLYQRSREGAVTNMAGHDLDVDYPAEPHIHLKPSRQEPPEQTCAQILERLDDVAPPSARAS